MLHRLTGQAEACRKEAILAEFKADQATSDDLRQSYRRLVRGWLTLARGYELAEQISEFLAWKAEMALPPFTESTILAPSHTATKVAQIEELSTWRKKLRAEAPADHAR